MTLTAIPGAGAPLRAATFSALMIERLTTAVRLSSDFPLTVSNTTLEVVTGLLVPVAAGATYDGECVISVLNSSGTTEDVKIGFSFPSGATMRRWAIGPATGITGTSGDGEWREDAITSGTTALAFGVIGGGVRVTIKLPFTLIMGGVSGNLQVLAAQNTSGGNTVNVRNGSKILMNQTG